MTELIRIIIMLFMLAVFVGMIIFAFKMMPGTQTIQTTLPASNIKNNIIHALSKHGFVVTTQTESSLTLVKETKPNCAIGCILLLLCVIPAIIYALLGGSKQPVVATISESIGNRIVKITGPGLWVYMAKKALKLNRLQHGG